MAAKPFRQDIMEGVVRRMLQEQAEGTRIEAATALAYAEAYSKATDLGGLQGLPKGVQYLITKVLPVVTFFSGSSS